MSKTVTIPNCMSPFIVMVNGMRYVYPAGETMEVPDEVALVIEKHYAYHEEKEKIERGEGNQGGGSSEYVDYFVMRITNQELSEYRNDTITDLINYSFAGWSRLRKVHLPELLTIGVSAFQSSGITKLDLPKIQSIGASAFAYTNLVALIIRTPSVCTLVNTSALTSSSIAKGTGYIYVPKALVESYKEATNWSTYANQIRAIEDYPDVTGGTDEPISTEGYETNVDGTA